MLKEYFALRGTLKRKKEITIFLIGIVFFISIWQILTGLGFIPRGILPSPWKVVMSFPKMHFEDALVRNAIYSTKLNLLGLFEAAILAVPLGILIGIFPGLRALFQKHIEVIRFLPMTALTGLFISWCGIGDNMKIQFLTFSIFFYLLPLVIGRVDEVSEEYVQSIYTLGANKWQTIRHVFIPYVVSNSIQDIRITAGVSWTYIVVAEMVNANAGGIGAMAYLAGRFGKIPEVFATVFVIIFIGFFIDTVINFGERKVFRYKFVGKNK